jgi:hypothetical protein
MFAGKARVYPSGLLEKYFTRVGSWPYPQTLNLVGKACQVHSSFYSKIRKLRTKKFYKFGSWPQEAQGSSDVKDAKV